ncbi:Bone morphoproteintic protein 1 [Sparganum proliferum]
MFAYAVIHIGLFLFVNLSVSLAVNNNEIIPPQSAQDVKQEDISVSEFHAPRQTVDQSPIADDRRPDQMTSVNSELKIANEDLYPVTCGGYLEADEGNITSPGYPDEYPPRMECDWKIAVPAGFSILLTFSRFELLPEDDCPYNYLAIYDGPSDSSPLLRRLCGAQMPAPIKSSNNTVTVRFVVDGVLSRNVFVVTFRKVSAADVRRCETTNHNCEHKCVSTPDGYMCQCDDGYSLLPDGKSCQVTCGGYLEADEGNITSPGYPDEYPPRMECDWKIALLPEDDCPYNYLAIYDGPSDSSPLLRRLCGAQMPAPIKSSNNTVTVRFVVDGVLARNVFVVTFRKVSAADVRRCETTNHNCEHKCVSTPDGYMCQCDDGYSLLPDGKSCQVTCGGYLEADEGNITSPGYPDEYPPRMECDWKIAVPAGFSILLTFSRFELLPEDDCPYNYLAIYDGPSDSSPLLRRLCGAQMPAPIKSSNNTVTVRFVVDGVLSRNVFVVTFRKG